MSSIPTLDVKPTIRQRTHPLPDLTSISKSLQYTYLPSPDKIDTNLLILFHGLGDTLRPFLDLGSSLRLLQTAILVLQGPERVPLIEEEAYQWWHSFDELGEMIRNPNPTITLKLLLSVLHYLTNSTPNWEPSSIHLFGFAQGGSCAAELCLAFSTSTSTPTTTSSSLGSLVTISGPLLSHPTLSKKAQTKVLVVGRKGEERIMGVGSFKKGFEDVKECSLSRGEGMLRGREDWEPVMKFWAKNLGRRSAMEFEKDVYEIGGGIESARAAGVDKP